MSAIKPLFANTQSGATSRSKTLVEFRAGRMDTEARENGSIFVVPDKRKGVIKMQKGEDQLMHFSWKDRATEATQEDWIIFPGDVEFTRVKQCTTGRVFALKFKSTACPKFYWMQEPRESRDALLCKKVNTYLKMSPTNQAESTSDLLQELIADNEMPSSPGAEYGLNEGNAGTTELIQELMANNGMPSSLGAEYLQSILSGMQVPKIEKEPKIEEEPKIEKEPPVNLSYGLTAEAITPILKNTEFIEKAKSHLPQFQGDVANEITSTISSPQFQQALQLFSTVFQSGELAPLIQQFNLGDPAIKAAAEGNMEAFVKALQENQNTESGNEDVEMADQ